MREEPVSPLIKTSDNSLHVIRGTKILDSIELGQVCKRANAFPQLVASLRNFVRLAPADHPGLQREVKWANRLLAKFGHLCNVDQKEDAA